MLLKILFSCLLVFAIVVAIWVVMMVLELCRNLVRREKPVSNFDHLNDFLEHVKKGDKQHGCNENS